MSNRVDRDLNRFRQIVRGKIKKDLRKYMSQGEMIGRQGRRYVSIPLPQIDIPQFRFGQKQGGGVGQGEGDVGDPIGRGDGQEGSGEAGEEPRPARDRGRCHARRAGPDPGRRAAAAEYRAARQEEYHRRRRTSYTGIARVGPNSLRHFKRTYREALKRQISTGEYNPDDPIVVPIRDDMRYRSWKDDAAARVATR